jgi:hypothetical protein
LKDTMGLRRGKATLNKALDDPWNVHANVTKTRGTQTATNMLRGISNLTSITPQRIVGQPMSRIVHTVTPDGRDTVRHVPVKNLDNSLGTHFLAGGGPDVSGGRQVQVVNGNKNQFSGGLPKPITIMAKDPATGEMKPVTLYPKNTVTNEKGQMTIQLGPNPSNIRLASSATSGIRLGTAGKPIILGGNMMRMPIMPQMPGAGGPRHIVLDTEHGLICKDGCTCPMMNVRF